MIDYFILDINNLCLDKKEEIYKDLKQAIEKHKDYTRLRKVTFYDEQLKPEAIKLEESKYKTLENWFNSLIVNNLVVMFIYKAFKSILRTSIV